MADFASLPLFTDAWVADTAHLSRAERGLYMDMLVLCWRTSGCKVPDDRDWLARKLRCEPEERPVLDALIAEFMTRDGRGRLYQKRLLREWTWVNSKREKQQAAAKARWTNGNGGSERSADAERSHSERNAPSPSPTPIRKKESESILPSSESLTPRANPRDDDDRSESIENSLAGIDRELVKLLLDRLSALGVTIGTLERQVRSWRGLAPPGVINAYLNDALRRSDVLNPLSYAHKGLLNREAQLDVQRELARSPPPPVEDPIFVAYRMTLEMADAERREQQGTHGGPDGEAAGGLWPALH